MHVHIISAQCSCWQFGPETLRFGFFNQVEGTGQKNKLVTSSSAKKNIMVAKLLIVSFMYDRKIWNKKLGFQDVGKQISISHSSLYLILKVMTQHKNH